jgi:hypothetical protein
LALKLGVIDLPRGTCKSIDGDLNVDEEGSTLMKKAPVNNYTTTLLVTNMCTNELASPRWCIPTCAQPRTQARIGKNATKLVDE